LKYKTTNLDENMNLQKQIRKFDEAATNGHKTVRQMTVGSQTERDFDASACKLKYHERLNIEI